MGSLHENGALYEIKMSCLIMKEKYLIQQQLPLAEKVPAGNIICAHEGDRCRSADGDHHL